MRLEQITFTRFIAAILIVIYHFGKGIYPFDKPSIHNIAENGNLTVSYFFILSGFIMIVAYNKKTYIDTYTYLKDRFARIYPAVLLSVVIYIFIAGYLNILGDIKLHEILLNLYLLQAWLPGKVLVFNYPLWSLSVEVLFYVLFPYMFNKYFTKYSIKKLALPIIIFWVLSAIILHIFTNIKSIEVSPDVHQFLHFFPLMHLNAFLIGNLAGLLYIKKFKDKSGNYDIHLLICFALIFLAFNYPFGLNYHNGLLAVLFVPALLLMSINNGILTRLFKLRFFVFLGEISYGIYVLHIPVYPYAKVKLQSYFGYDNNEVFMFYASTLCVIIASVISYYLVEKPCRDFIKRYSTKTVKVSV